MGDVLLTDGMQRSTLAVTRSLGKRGVDITICEDRLPCLSSSSKYCHSAFECPSPFHYPTEFIETLIEQLQKKKYDLLIPMTDITGYLIGNNVDRISLYTRISMVNWETYRLVNDKGKLISLCQKLSIPTPTTFFFERIEDIANSASEFSFPMIIKPRRSIYLTSKGWIKTSIEYASSHDDLIEKLKNWDDSLPFPMVQERIAGPGCGAFFLFNNGEEKVAFFHKRLREKPPSGGVSVLRESIPVHPKMEEYAVRLLKSLNWHGVAMVEFKQDLRDDLPKLMEINARFWGSLQLAIDSGVDFPYKFYQMAINGDTLPVIGYNTGIKTRWLLGDLDHLLSRIFKISSLLNLPEGYPNRLATLFNFLLFYQSGMKYEILKRDDIRPFFFEAKEWMKMLFAGE